jgi:Cell Wall Hydrolase
MVVRSCLIGLALAVNILLPVPAQASPALPKDWRLELGPTSSDLDSVAASELYCMTLALFLEGGSSGEPEDGLRHIARVIAERAKANRPTWGGPTICGVVFHKAGGVCQFSFICLPSAWRTPRMGPLWDFAAAIADQELKGESMGPDERIRYFMNAELSSLRSVCWFRRELVPVAKVGSHEFFREPTVSELKELSEVEFDACTRYAAALNAQRVRANKKRSAREGQGQETLFHGATPTRLIQVEAHLRVKLCDRSAGKLTRTDAGTSYAAALKRIRAFTGR